MNPEMVYFSEARGRMDGRIILILYACDPIVTIQHNYNLTHYLTLSMSFSNLTYSKLHS